MPESILERIQERIDELSAELLEVSHAIHAHPELAFEETFACETLTTAAARHHLEPEAGVFTLETAFEAGFNRETPGPTIALLAEYDALPSIGHACGHNIIATAALGATLGLQAVAAELRGELNTEAEIEPGVLTCTSLSFVFPCPFFRFLQVWSKWNIVKKLCDKEIQIYIISKPPLQ